MMGRTDSRLRHVAILVTFAVVGACLVGRLAWWQVVRGADLAADARRETTIDLTDPSRRGTDVLGDGEDSRGHGSRDRLVAHDRDEARELHRVDVEDREPDVPGADAEPCQHAPRDEGTIMKRR